MSKKFKALAACAGRRDGASLTACGGSGDAAKSEGDSAAAARRPTFASSPAASPAPTRLRQRARAVRFQRRLRREGHRAFRQRLAGQRSGAPGRRRGHRVLPVRRLGLRLRGTNIFEKDGAYKDFSIVADLYQEQVQIVTCDPNIKTVADLAGKNVSVGAAGSGVYFNAVDVLAAYDMTLDDIKPVYQSFADSADSLKDNKIDAAFIVAGAPPPPSPTCPPPRPPTWSPWTTSMWPSSSRLPRTTPRPSSPWHVRPRVRRDHGFRGRCGHRQRQPLRGRRSTA